MTNKTVPEQRTFKLSGTMKKLRGANALNDRVQVRLYEGTAGFGCDLGEPITMGCALKLMKRIHTVPRPEKICLDANECRFFAKLIYGYPTHYSDKAVAQLRLGTHFGYIGTSCNICNNYPMYECAKKIRLGECRDEFIRQTVGVTMFPELYANKKQK